MANKIILITRLFDALPALVFDCWLKPEHLINWYSAGDGWTTPHAYSDAVAGGRFNIGFKGPDGPDGVSQGAFDFTGTYDEVTPPAKGKTGRLVFSTDDKRTMTVEFAEQGGKTMLTLHLELENVYPEEQQRHGWSAMLENLGTLSGKDQVVISTNTYLNFQGNCEEAFKTYEKILGGKIIAMMKARGSPMEGHVAPEFLDKVMHARMTLGAAVIMGSDSPSNIFKPAQGFSINIGVDTPAEADRIYAGLAEGGTQTMPIAETFWAHRFGMCVDRFGTPWMVNCEKPMS